LGSCSSIPLGRTAEIKKKKNPKGGREKVNKKKQKKQK